MQSERAKYIGIYGNQGLYPKYGHTNHGDGARALVRLLKPQSILDVGCGHNEFAKKMRQDGYLAIGADFACPGADVEACVTGLPFFDRCFDIVTAFDVLEHLHPAEVEPALAELRRVSRAFVFSISYVPSANEWKGQNLHPSCYPESWWVDKLHSAGASVERLGRYIFGRWLDFSYRSVVLVGNGPGVLQGEFGRAIDAFDEVVRFNTYQLTGWEKHVGTKTTLWSTFGRGTQPPDPRPRRAVLIHGHPTYTPEELYRVPRRFFDLAQAMVRHRSQLPNVSQLLPTSGLVVALWLLEAAKAKKLYLAGFDHFSKKNSKQHHYWLSQRFGQPHEHDGAVESAIFKELETAGKVGYLTA